MTYNLTKTGAAWCLIIFAAFLVFSVIFLAFSIEDIEHLFSIGGSLSIVVALLAYLYKKEQDQIISTIDQITFFREIIIPESDSVRKEMIKKDPQFVVSRISLKKPSIVEIKEELPTNFDRQLEIFFDAKTAYPSFILDAKILDRQITLLNLLEEFSLKVLARGTTSSPVLKALHNVFVETVEQNSVALLFVRDLKNTPPTYESILSLYRAWVDGTTKTVLIKNLYSAGLINKEQKDYFYTVRREEKGF